MAWKWISKAAPEFLNECTRTSKTRTLKLNSRNKIARLAFKNSVIDTNKLKSLRRTQEWGSVIYLKLVWMRHRIAYLSLQKIIKKIMVTTWNSQVISKSKNLKLSSLIINHRYERLYLLSLIHVARSHSVDIIKTCLHYQNLNIKVKICSKGQNLEGLSFQISRMR